MNSVVARIALAAGLILAAAMPAWPTHRAGEQKVLILPPAIHGPAEMAYLGRGLVDMLSTRLAHPGKTVIVTLNPVADLPQDSGARTLAAASGRRAGADHVVFGSLTLLGNSISTDLRMLDVAAGAVVVAFSRSGSDPSALIEHADLFAVQANQKVFGRVDTDPAGSQPMVKPPEPPPAPTSLIHQHPEKLLQQPMGLEGEPYGGDGMGAVLIGAASAVRGPRISGQVQSLAIGDVDGDGTLDIVAAGLSKLWIYKYENSRFVKMAEIDGHGNYIGVDLSDVNGNGREEIFVTNFSNDNGKVSSFVMEYDGRKFERTARLLDLYFRAINVPMRGRVLFGQRQGLETLFQPGVYEIVWENGKYRRGTRLKVPRRQNVFGLGLGTMPTSRQQMVFAYNASTRLQVTDIAGDEEWVSTEGYGNVAALIQTRSRDDLSGSDYHFVAGRIEIVDLDGDGVEEAVVLRNEDVTGNFTKRTRLFKHGRIEILKTDELGMSARLRTRYLPKFISDFAVGDLDRDGKPEILTAVVQKTENVAASGRTNIYLFNVDGLTTAQQ